MKQYKIKTSRCSVFFEFGCSIYECNCEECNIYKCSSSDYEKYKDIHVIILGIKDVMGGL